MTAGVDAADTVSLAAELAAAAPQLMSKGWAVIDDALPAETLSLLREQMAGLHKAGGLRQHRFGFKESAAGQVQIFEKPCIFEAELDDEAVGRCAPLLAPAMHGINLQAAATEAFPSLRLLSGRNAVAVKLQCNEGGGCFPHHYDNAGPPSKRRVTALFYLNPSWRECDGGELLLSPWLQPAVRIPPVHGRLVLFLSDVLLHRVLPCHARRYCFTIWLDGEGTNDKAALQLDARKPCDGALLLDPAQRLLSRAVYSEEYEASIRECFQRAPAEQREAVLRSHTSHVEGQMANAAFARLASAARALKARHVGVEELVRPAEVPLEPEPELEAAPTRRPPLELELRIRALGASRVRATMLARAQNLYLS